MSIYSNFSNLLNNKYIPEYIKINLILPVVRIMKFLSEISLAFDQLFTTKLTCRWLLSFTLFLNISFVSLHAVCNFSSTIIGYKDIVLLIILGHYPFIQMFYEHDILRP